MVRTLVLSLALHVALVAALSRASRPPSRARGPIELSVLSRSAPRVEASSTPGREPRTAAPPAAPAAKALSRGMALAAPRLQAAEPLAAASRPAREPPGAAPESRSPGPSRDHEPPALRESRPRVDLFARAALAAAAELPPVDRPPSPGPAPAPSAAERAWRPRRGVGGADAAGGVDVASFLAEDAARQRVAKGAVLPELRRVERRLDETFVPTFAQADVSNRAELFIKQMRGFLRNPPKTGELARGIDPAKETYAEKLRSMRPEQAFFLGRRVEVFVRQKPDGSIVEMAVRSASGYRGFDDAALAAVERALGGRLPAGTANHAGDVRTLWQLDATAYVVVSPNPVLQFDEASGRYEWIYPLQKRVDHHVRLVAIY